MITATLELTNELTTTSATTEEFGIIDNAISQINDEIESFEATINQLKSAGDFNKAFKMSRYQKGLKMARTTIINSVTDYISINNDR